MADILWPFEPSLHEPIVEEYGYATDVLAATNGMEQRRGLRRHPVASVEFSFREPSTRELAPVFSLLYRNMANRWLVPLFWYGSALTGSAAAGVYQIPVSTVNIPFRDPLGLGRYAVLWKDRATTELVQIASLAASTVDVVDPLVATWTPPRVYLMPCRIARLDPLVSYVRETGFTLTGRARFTFDAAEDPEAFAPIVMFGGGAVLPGG